MRLFFSLLFAALLALPCAAQNNKDTAAKTVAFSTSKQAKPKGKTREVNFSILATSDVHGNYFDYDFTYQRPGTGGLSRLSTYIKHLRKAEGRFNILYMDNGDLLQGTPVSYYYNYVNQRTPHLAARILNELDCLCATPGNHDIEVGKQPFDRWMNDCAFTILGANVVDLAKKKLALTAYVMEEVEGVKIAVIGLITPSIPQWVPKRAWEGWEFRDMIDAARRVVPIARRAGKADVVVVLMHSGLGPSNSQEKMLDNAAAQLAEQVPNIDLIVCGHDHRLLNRRIANKTTSRTTLLLNPANDAQYVAQANFKVKLNAEGKVIDKELEGQLRDIRHLTPDTAFNVLFAADLDSLKRYTQTVVGYNNVALETRSAYFGANAMVDFIHQVQLDVSKADISMAAPLAFDASIPAGKVLRSDLFRLYKYENQLYVLKLTGAEIKAWLEESYGRWTRHMNAPTEPMLNFRPELNAQAAPWQRLAYSSYDFDSAAGLRYTVHLDRPRGQKVTISSLANGRPFSLSATYRVAVNSYRACGGGGHLTQGVGLSSKQLAQRVVWTSPHELRYYLEQALSLPGGVTARPLYHWRFVPEGWAAAAGERDYETLFRPLAQ